MSAHADKFNRKCFVHCNIQFVLTKKVEKIYLYFGDFLSL